MKAGNLLRRSLSLLLTLSFLLVLGATSFAEDTTEQVSAVNEVLEPVGNVTVLNESPAIIAQSNEEGATASVTATGNVSDTAGSAAGAVAVAELGTAMATVEGNVTSTGEKESVGAHAGAKEGTATTTVNGDVKAEATAEEGSVAGARAMTNEGTVTTTVKGNVEVAGEQAVGAFSAAYMGDGVANIVVGGDVKATGEAVYAVEAFAGKGTATTTVGGDVTATGEKDVNGAYVSAKNGGTATIKIDGNVNANAANESGQAIGAYLFVDDDGAANLVVDGNVTAKGTYSDGIIVSMSSGDEDTTATANVTVSGDVTGANGLTIIKDKDSAANITVEGALSAAGEDGTAILVGKDVTTDNLNLTVWKIEPDADGALVKQQDWDPADGHMITEITEETKAIEANIQYIIKVEPTQKNVFAGTQEIAKEGEIAMVKLTVPAGYKLNGAFTDEGKSVKLQKDNSGNYYVEMPRGGGVYLSASLSEIPAAVVDLSVGNNSTVKVVDSQYVVVLTTKQASMTFLRSTLERFAKLNDKLIIKTEKGSYALSIAELLSFNENAINFRIVLTDEAVEIYVNGALFKSVGFGELV